MKASLPFVTRIATDMIAAKEKQSKVSINGLFIMHILLLL
jgi:hypothetical protein